MKLVLCFSNFIWTEPQKYRHDLITNCSYIRLSFFSILTEGASTFGVDSMLNFQLHNWNKYIFSNALKSVKTLMIKYNCSKAANMDPCLISSFPFTDNI